MKTAAGMGITAVLFNRDHTEYDGIVVNTFQESGKLLGAGG